MGAEQNKQLVHEAFSAWERGDSRPFFQLLDPDVSWTVIGTTPISGTYSSKKAFLKGAAGQLTTKLQGPIMAKVRNVLADGDHVILQWEGSTEATNGTPYRQTYCWVMRIEGGKVKEATAYLDTALIDAVLA
jgi:ketosteroid isomerase-like protein